MTLSPNLPSGDKPVLMFWAMADGNPWRWPSQSFTAWIPLPSRIEYTRPMPGSDDPAAMLRWLAEQIEAKGCDIPRLGW